MSKRVTFIVPAIKGQSVEGIQKWVESLPELALVGDIQVIPVFWEEAHAGSVKDWLSTVQQIVEHWSETNGFVIWAPGHALLELAGSLRLIVKEPGKPIILFAADKPKQVLASKNKLLGLKSTLINASFLAQSDLAEVLVLADGQVYRPQQCGWGREVKSYELISTVAPIATIDFKLTVLGEHKHRNQQDLSNTLPLGFSSGVRFMQWFPGMRASIEQMHEGDQAVVMTNAEFWGHPEVLTLQKQLQKEGVPTIWYSQQPWRKQMKLASSELAVSHEQPWWVTLVSQFSFGNAKKTQQALKEIKFYCQ